MNTQRLTLDLDKSSVPRGRVTIAQCDHDGTTVEAEIYDNGVALNTSGLSAYLVMRLPDGRHYYRVPATLDGHVATALVDEAYAAVVVGTTEIAYFELVGSGDVYSTSRFGVRVLPSATAGATVPETWDGEVEQLIQQLDDAIETATDAANVANAAAANADATADGVESRVQEMAQDAAETATADAEQRIQDAIDAMGDISELAVPLMNKDIRGGAKLEENGGLALRDGALGIGSLVQESDGYARGGLAEVTAKGHAEQFSTTGKNLLPNNATSRTISGVTFTVNADGSITANGTATARDNLYLAQNVALAGGTYTISGAPNAPNDASWNLRCEDYASPNTYRIFDNGFAGTPQTGVIPENTPQQIMIRFYQGAIFNNATFYPQLELGSTATEYEPYTGAAPSPSPEFPQTIEVVSGRNLLDSSLLAQPSDNHSRVRYNNRAIHISAGTTLVFTSSDSALRWAIVIVSDSSSVATGSGNKPTDTDALYDSGWQNQNTPITVTASGWLSIPFKYDNDPAITAQQIAATKPQLNLGSIPQPYVPYGHVGMEVRDPDTNTLISCTALPLPSRGWVGSLPDGTADVLTLDGAGKVKWEENTWEETFDGSSDESWYGHTRSCTVTVTPKARSIAGSAVAELLCTHFIKSTPPLVDGGNLGVSQWTSGERLWFSDGTGSMTLDAWKTWLSTHPVTVLYPLATPITEDCGYVDMPEISSDAVVSIPELDALGVKYFVDDSVTEYGRQMYARAYAELGDAITELAARVVALES